MRRLFLKASESRWLAAHLPAYPFARRAVRRFMPGETLDDALAECGVLATRDIGTVITRLGENIRDTHEAAAVAQHYCDALADIRRRVLPTQLSVKLTQLGLDISHDDAIRGVRMIMRHAAGDTVWIDMESSAYTAATIDVFEHARADGEHVGICLQAYLKRTASDLTRLLEHTTAIRLVKGAYNESPEIAFARKRDVDTNYIALARTMLERVKKGVTGNVPVFATHDVAIIDALTRIAEETGVGRQDYEFQMLYGINARKQQELARDGHRVRVLISYGSAWFAWYMRRLAERPANVLFVLKSVIAPAPPARRAST